MKREAFLACMAVVACLAGAPATHGHSAAVGPAAAVSLGVCDMSVAAVREFSGHLRTFVPASYRLGRSLYTLGLPTYGLVVFWTMACDRIEIPDGAPQKAIVSLTGVQVEAPERPSSVVTIANEFDVYTVAAHTDNEAVARWLRASGMPVTAVPGLRMERARQVRIAVPDGAAGHEQRLAPAHPDPVGAHRHTNAFWHDEGGRTSRLGLDIPRATDVACVQLPLACGVVVAGPTSPVRRLLRDDRRPVDFVFDHTRLTDVTVHHDPEGTPR